MRLVLLCVTLAAVPSLAGDFEGVIIGKPVVSGINPAALNSMKMYLSPAGFRVEASGQKAGPGGGPFQMTMLWRAADPGVTYLLNDAAKAYMKHDITKAKAAETEAPKVEKLGKTTYLGHSVERVKVTFANNRTSELWIDTSLRFPSAALAAFGQEQGRNSAWQALEKAGVSGIPLKELNVTPGRPDQSGTSGWEASSVEKQSLPASTFQVPSDFHETKDPLDLVSPSQQTALKKQRDEALKNMTPEQRAKFEEMMKKYQQ
ncbi:MAG: DUF4412 domain-containing protein [Myxococcaceae bacterium]